jgi:hypothetical protein
MNAIVTHEAQSMDLIKTILESQHLPGLFAGKDTHDPALRLVGHLVRHTPDDDLITQIVAAALPPPYVGNTLAELPGMIASARAGGFDTSREPTMAELVLRYVKNAGIVLFHDSRERGFMSVPQPSGAVLNLQLGTKSARAVLGRLFYKERDRPLPSRQLKEAMDALEAMAQFEGEKHEVDLRVARMDNAIYVDLGRDDGLVVEINAEGWRTTHDCPVKFERRPGFGELPIPVEGGSMRSLQELLQLDEANFILLTAFLLICLRTGSTYMCLFVEGEQGSGKSVLCEVIKRIIDPNVPLRLRLPGDDRNLMIVANAFYLPIFDNVSGFKGDLSDALCTLSTGGGFAARQLYSDDGVAIIDVTRPFVINGIGDFANRPDLMERAIPIKLPAMSDHSRKTEEELRAEFDALLPGLLGALYAISGEALRNERSVELGRTIRMADCAKWLLAAETATGFPANTMLPLLEDSQTEMVVDRISDLPLTMLLRQILAKGPVEDTVGELFIALTLGRPKGDRSMPPTPAHLSKELKRLKPALAKADILIEIGAHRREGRLVKLWRKDQAEDAFRKAACEW